MVSNLTEKRKRQLFKKMELLDKARTNQAISNTIRAGVIITRDPRTSRYLVRRTTETR